MPPRHEKAARYLRLGIFDRVRSFASFEKRIAGLPEGDRGPAFEVFAEAYLATQKTQSAKEVWPGNTVPHHLETKFRLAGAVGVDGVFETLTGQVCGYQVKFRSGRPTLTFAEISPFLGITDRVDRRVLFTNCDSISGLTEKRVGFYAIRGQDLDELEPRDFKAISAWLRQAAIRPEKYSPRPYQEAAVKDILDGLKKHDRATAIMACGTGKTLVTLWVAERMGCKKILVLVPSLALLDQTLKEWLRHTNWSMPTFISVCSDPTVEKGVDELVIREADLRYKVDTDPKQVRRFLDSGHKGVKLVFCTYQSSHILGRAVSRKNPFDLGIFDEAHKTAGREGTNYSFALDDKRLPIRKRLFVTATPRHYDIRKRDKEGDAKLVYSMDVPELYGPRVHTLTFAEAAKKGIICDYKVVISLVTSGMVNADLIRRGEVIVKRDVIKAQQVASQIALQKAVEETGVTKIITFHRTVDSARSFIGLGGEGVSAHLPNFATDHVRGMMPSSERKRRMDAFRDAPKAIISNARCLTEGVDVPAIDMVAFIAPKRSRIDIVQATGRAMRKPPKGGKNFGYVLVPLFIEQAKGETLKEALIRTDYEEVWQVLQAMQEQDDDLAEIIRQMREERGRTKGYDDSRFRGKVLAIGPKISLYALRKSIATRCIDYLGDNWDERYGELKAFKEKFGHCNVPPNYKYKQLQRWVFRQRQNVKRLTQDRIQRLNEIGFVWTPLEAAWEEMYEGLTEFKNKKGHCNVPQRWPVNPQLATWVRTQRGHKDQLTQDRIKRLDDLGFEWTPFETAWEEMYEDLVKYKKKHRNCKVPQQWSENSRLATWVAKQRVIKERLTPDQTNRLDKLGFVWNPIETVWEEMYDALAEFKKNMGHCNVPAKWKNNNKLANWVIIQRYKKHLLSQNRIKRLKKLGFVWKFFLHNWERMYDALNKYKEKKGDCNVPLHWPEDPKLAMWVRKQRQRKKLLSRNRITKLNELGFVWDYKNTAWDEMLQALAEYKKKKGNCNVPQRWPENQKLARWVNGLRVNKERLTLDRIKRLNKLGFVLKPAEAYWEEMFDALVEYKRKKRNCNVPQRWPENQKLGHWVNSQRVNKEQLAPDRVKLLNDIGFIWNQNEAAWDELFYALADYKKKKGHCNPPRGWPDNPKLGNWVINQRRNKKTKKLRSDRVKRLDKLGFDWGIRKGKSSHNK